MKLTTAFSTLILLVMGVTNVNAVAPCDCTVAGWLGECLATLEVKGSWVKVHSNARQCSRVDWFVDNEQISQMTIVLDGVEVEDVSPRTPKKVVVQSCKVCKDNRLGAQTESTGTKNDESATALTIAGTWTGSERNIFGFSRTITVNLYVARGVVSGTWQSNQGVSEISGSANGNQATVSLSGGGAKNFSMTLIAPDTLEYSFGFGGGKLKRSP